MNYSLENNGTNFTNEMDYNSFIYPTNGFTNDNTFTYNGNNNNYPIDYTSTYPNRTNDTNNTYMTNFTPNYNINQNTVPNQMENMQNQMIQVIPPENQYTSPNQNEQIMYESTMNDNFDIDSPLYYYTGISDDQMWKSNIIDSNSLQSIANSLSNVYSKDTLPQNINNSTPQKEGSHGLSNVLGGPVTLNPSVFPIFYSMNQ